MQAVLASELRRMMILLMDAAPLFRRGISHERNNANPTKGACPLTSAWDRRRSYSLVPAPHCIELRQGLGIIPGGQDALRDLGVAGFETRLFARDFVFEVEHAPGAADQTAGWFHGFTHGYHA